MTAGWLTRAEAPDQVMRHVRSGNRCFVHGASATPTTLLDALARQTSLEAVTLCHLHLVGPLAVLDPVHDGRFRSVSLFTGPACRGPIAEGRADYVPVFLSGQACADSLGHRIYSGIGGQMDFMRGAARSVGGKPIIAMSSTTAGGTVSRIVRELNPGAGVVTTRGHVHWVVTEYGAVNLHGRTMRERAELLTSIAHPDFRNELR